MNLYKILFWNGIIQNHLTHHQLFIDTTRNSGFYKNLINWNLNEYIFNTITRSIKELNEISESQKVDFGDFPKLFVQINKLDDKFYLYDRCDGIDPRYELRNNAFIIYGPLESDAKTIQKVYQVNTQGIKLNLNTFATKTLPTTSKLEIFKTDYE